MGRGQLLQGTGLRDTIGTAALTLPSQGSCGRGGSELLCPAGHPVYGDLLRVEVLRRASHEDSAHVDLVPAKGLHRLPELQLHRAETS